MKPSLSIIIVTYNHEKFIGRCLQSISQNYPKTSIEILLVDNASHDSTLAIASLFRDKLNLRVIKNSLNLGFSKANNLAIRLARAKYILILNPDTEITQTSLNLMLRYLNTHPEVSCLVPRLIFPNGRLQESVRNFPTLATFMVRRTPLRLLKTKLVHQLNRRHLRAISYRKIQPISWALGGAILTRKMVFKQIGLFDERFFLYCEDIDWFYRLSLAKLKAWYYPPSVFIHYHQAISDHRLISIASLHHLKSMVKFCLKYPREILTGSYESHE